MLSQPSEPPAEMVADIRARLGRVCESYPPDEFSELVRQIAHVRAKYEARRAESFFEAARILGAAERITTAGTSAEDHMVGPAT